MLVSPKWQTMWMESQHCSKNSVNVSVPSQQAKKLLEDIRASCSSPNKSVQLEALKCWGVWISNQNQEDWKLNTVCYTAARPLLTKKLQPLQKDVDICKLRFSLMWALLRKVQSIMQLEGPQYILEVFLQSCLNWLSTCTGDGEEEVTELIFQLLLAVFSKEESTNIYEKEMFQSLSADIFKISKVFNRLADKFLNVFVYWKKIQNKTVILKLWKHFLERCEMFCEHIAVPVWHKVFKLVGQICAEKSEPVKERLGMLHGCATTLRSVLSSSKFLDCGNLLLTPCEALFKKLVDLCCSECEEFYDAEMFVQGLETSKVLSVESVAIGGYGQAINVLNLLDEFSLKSLHWGVWCGLVHCYKSLLSNIDETHLTKIEVNFYRKLRGVAINFELDKSYLGEECIIEVERHIRVLNVCPCSCRSRRSKEKCEKEVQTEITMRVCDRSLESPGIFDPNPDKVSGQLLPKIVSDTGLGRFLVRKKAKRPQPRVININFDLVNHILKTVGVSCVKSLFDKTFSFRFISLRVCDANIKTKDFSLLLKAPRKKRVTVRTLKANKAITYSEENWKADDEVKCVPKTRSQKRAEEEEKRKEMEYQRRKTRKSFETRVQEIVQKNKERKTEKNYKKSPMISLREKRKKLEEEKTETQDRKPKKQNKKEKSPKLENYFKVITKNSGSSKKEEASKERKKKKKEEVNWKQRSLRMMIAEEKKPEGVRTRSKEKKVSNGKVKTKMMEDSPLAKLSPFKEVFHDHEYAKLELQDLRALERVFVNKEKSENKTAKMGKISEVPEIEKETNREEKKGKKKRTKGREGMRKSKRLASETVTPSEPEIQKVCETEATPESITNVENVPERLKESKRLPLIDPTLEKLDTEKSFEKATNILTTPESFSQVANVSEVPAAVSMRSEGPSKMESISEVDTAKSQCINCSPKMVDVSEVDVTETHALESLPKEVKIEEAAAEVVDAPEEKRNTRLQSPANLDESDEYSELDSTPRRGKKRIRLLDGSKPIKKLKLEDAQVALEVEKENLEEVPASKEEKSLKGSPNAMNGMISSRALRMIALIPESTRSQIHWETSPKVEVKKKGPNVDKNSRASKMLALLSENVREVVEPEEIQIVEVKSNDLEQTSLVKTPTSSLKSPKTVKQKRSIRFDDTKNETVVYETDTPPSQVLEGKERWRRIKLPEANFPIHTIP